MVGGGDNMGGFFWLGSCCFFYKNLLIEDLAEGRVF